MRINVLLCGLMFFCLSTFAQNKNFLDQPYLETVAEVDTLVIPDRIFLEIEIQESDTKGKVSAEELEMRLINALKTLGIDIEKQLSLADISSDFKKYTLKRSDILKDKSFELLVYDAQSVGRVLYELEKLEIANVRLLRTEYSKMESLKAQLKAKAILKAQNNGKIMTDALGQKLGKAIYISDSGSQYGVEPIGYASRALNEVVFLPNEAEFRKIRVEVSVKVKFLLD